MSRPKLVVDSLRNAVLARGYVPSRLVRTMDETTGSATAASGGETVWLTPKETAQRARCGVKTIYREVKAGRLRAARVGGRRELRIKPEWVDQWLVTTATPIEVAA